MSANGFWRALERHVEGATAHERKRTTGHEFDAFRRWLRPMARKAMTDPINDEWGYESRFDVIEHGPSDIVAVCQETGEREVLAPADIVMYAINRDAILRTLAESLGLEPVVADANENGCHRVGALPHAGKRAWVRLCWHTSRGNLMNATIGWIASVAGESMLLTPTRQAWTRQLMTLIENAGKRLVALEDSVIVDERGQWHVDQALPAILRGDDQSASANSPTFRWDGSRWHIAFDDVTGHPHDRVGLHYIRFLLAEPRRVFAAHELVELRTGKVAAPSKSRQFTIDTEGQRRLEKKLRELAADCECAGRDGDAAVLEEIDAEVAAISKEVERSRGFNGRGRVIETGDGKHRRGVAKAIDEAIESLRKPLPRLAEHLDATIEKRGGLRYAPNAAVEWRV